MERRVALGARLQRFRNCHRGGRLVLVCNGPSLNQTDFSLIRNEVSMGLNKIFLGFRRLRFYPRYYLAINRRVIEQSAQDIAQLNCVRFLKNMSFNPLPESALTYLLHAEQKNVFTKILVRVFRGLHRHFLRFATGFFYGLLHSGDREDGCCYSFTGLPNEPHVLKGRDPNHFDPSYFSGHTWDNPILPTLSAFMPWRVQRMRQTGVAFWIAQMVEPAKFLKKSALRRY